MSALGDRIREIIPTIVPGALTGAVQAALARAVDELDDNRDAERRRLAGLAMQGLLAAEANVKIMDCAHEAGTGLPTKDLVPIVEQRLAQTCVRLADYLLAELAKPARSERTP